MKKLSQHLKLDTGQDAITIYPVTSAGLEAFLADAESLAEGWVRTTGFKAGSGEVCLVPASDGSLASVLLGVGKGMPKGDDPWWLAPVVAKLDEGQYRIEGRLTGDSLAAGAFGWCMAHYRFDTYKEESSIKNRTLLVPKKAGINSVIADVEATALVRDMVNTPAEHMGPDQLEETARSLADEFDASISVISGDNLLNENFPTIHAVGRAASIAPRLIDLTWGSENNPRVTLVGKGVCFDSGGLDIKGSAFMRNMKKDMGGAAHVLGLAQMLIMRKLPIRLRVLIPAVENAISGNAFRPGDIITTRKGTSVEIGNTDAEGRLVLCDALTLACEEKPDILIDFATLTGAARVALGAELPALFVNDDAFAEALIEQGLAVGDPMWRLPLYEGYKSHLKSEVADMGNVSAGSYGGAITAALYLEHFVERGPRWAHIDTFAWRDITAAGRTKGGEALGMRAAFHAVNKMLGSVN